MTPREKGFLLLTSQLGDPNRDPLTVAQLRDLTVRVRSAEASNSHRQIAPSDLVELGYSSAMAQRIVRLLSQEDQLECYLQKGRRAGCAALTRVSPGYPAAVRKRLGIDSPGCLWAKGDAALLEQPCVSLVGSRELCEKNTAFARRAGMEAARQGYVLASGNARGADRTAQDACLENGGKVIVVVADALEKHRPREGVLYLSEDSYDTPFSSHRALSRNRVIHSLGSITLVAQSDLYTGGTWDGTTRNLRAGWSSVFCFHDGTEASRQLEEMGAVSIDMEALKDLPSLMNTSWNFFTR